jgi:competence protein ComEC
MININSGAQQGDAHLIKFPNGKYFLIDAGDSGNVLVPYLRSIGVKAIDKILVSHAHKDHYSGIYSIVEAGIPVEEVRFNIPDQGICQKERPWGCDWKDIQNLSELLRTKKISVKSQRENDVYYSANGVELKVLNYYNGIHTPVGNTDINDMSAILKLTHAKTSALFTGDLNNRLGEYLAKYGKNLSADILKVPHHGGDSMAPDSFFDVVQPKVALVPAPTWLWEDARTARLRAYLKKKKIPTYVNGKDGHVKVTFTDKGYSVTPSRERLPSNTLKSLQ